MQRIQSDVPALPGRVVPWRLGAWATLLAAIVPQARAQTTTLVSVTSNSTQANNSSRLVAISGNGRFVAFESFASNLVPDFNNRPDLFVRDRVLNLTERINVSSSGSESTGQPGPIPAVFASCSADGSRVAFSSFDSNLAPGSTGLRVDVFLRDRAAGTTTLVSRTPAGPAGTGESQQPCISTDGNFVAFVSSAPDLVPGDTNDLDDIFVRDLASGTTTRVNIGPGGAQANQDATLPCISGDGRFVAFMSSANNLVASDSNNFGDDVFVHDRQTGTNEIVSRSSSGAQVAFVGHLELDMSDDGRFVVFSTSSPLVVAGDTNNAEDIFVRDRFAGTTTRVSVSSSGAQGNAASFHPVISSEGRYVAFSSYARNLASPDSEGTLKVFVHDRVSATTERMSFDAAGQSDAGPPQISGDGRFVAFDLRGQFGGTPLLPGYSNGLQDVFVRDRGAIQFTPFCFGDGSANGGPACPCGNDVAAGVARGCVNSTGQGGKLVATGNPSISTDTVTLRGTELSPAAFALFLQSDSFSSGTPLFDGLRCVGASFVRLTTRLSVGGAATIGSPSMPISVVGGITSPSTRFYQVVYRNNAGFCNFLANSTNGIATVWSP